ncbi:MAG: glycosyltransferase family 4 protein [Chitinophagaceae bacterium]
MKIVLSHPTGNANVRATAKGFFTNEILDSFFTTIATFPGSKLDFLSTIGPLSEFRRRSFDPSLSSLTKTSPLREMFRLAASKLGWSLFTKHEAGLFCIDKVYRGLDKRVAATLKDAAHRGVSGVYAYEDAAYYTFKEAKRFNLQCFYDLPIGYWRSARLILEKEKQKWPDWISTLTGFDDSETKLAGKDNELRLADRIYVASSFTAKTLKEYPGDLALVETIPYGFPQVEGTRDYPALSKRALKVLFVGGLSQRKGIANLFAAIDKFKTRIELTVVGHKPSIDCAPLNKALSKHKWIPTLPHKEILALMRMSDVLVFPSLFEGFGLVITEAMSQGTPVITTERTAGPDLIQHGENGWLIEAGSTDAISNQIDVLLSDPVLLSIAGKNAMVEAASRPWNVYAQELTASITKHLSGN